MKQVVVVSFEHVGAWARIEAPLPARRFVASSVEVGLAKATEMLGLDEAPALNLVGHQETFTGDDGQELCHTVEEPDNPNRFAKVEQKGMHCRIYFQHVDFVD